MYSAFRYDVKSGNAPDNYGTPIDFDGTSKFIHIVIWDNPCYIQFSYDGVTFGDDFEIDPDDPPVELPFACRSFVIKNVTPLSIARFQVTSFW